MLFHKPRVYDLATRDSRPEVQLSKIVDTPKALSPWYCLVPPPLDDLADTREWISRLQEYPVCIGVTAEDWHERCKKRLVVTLMF